MGKCLASLVMLALAACAPSSADTEPTRDEPDVGGGFFFDAGTSAPPPATADASQEPSPSPSADAGAMDGFMDFLGLPADPSLDLASSERSCSGASTEIDCSSPGCQGLGSCCIGNPSCYGDLETSLPEALELECSGDLGACLGAELFGNPEPLVRNSILVLNGDGEFDSGATFAQALDLTTDRLTIDVTFAQPECTQCLQSAAIAVVDGAPTGADVEIDPLLALVYAPSRGQAMLVVRGVVAERWPATAMSWSLEILPDGRAIVSHAGELVAQTTYPLAKQAHLVLYGHGVDSSGGAPTGIAALGIQAGRCSMPDAWQAPRAVALQENDESLSFPSIDHTSVVEALGQRWMAVEVDGQILIGSGDASALSVVHDRFESAVDVRETWLNARHPSLYETSEGLRVAFVVDVDGTPAIVRNEWDGSLFVKEQAEYFMSPSDMAETGLAGSPSVIRHEGHDVVAAEATGGGLKIAIRGSRTDGRWLSFDVPARSDARHPNLIVHGNRYLLHYSWRQGTRWRVGLLASDSLLGWRDVSDEVLRGGDAMDDIGASAPTALSHGDELELYYVAHDGVRERLAARSRAAIERGSLR